MKILEIDTSSQSEVSVSLIVDNKRKTIKGKFVKGSQTVLNYIERILKENKTRVEDLSEINVNIGPGSYTGLKVGVSIANALGFALKIPVNGKKIGQIAEPVYK